MRDCQSFQIDVLKPKALSHPDQIQMRHAQDRLAFFELRYLYHKRLVGNSCPRELWIVGTVVQDVTENI